MAIFERLFSWISPYVAPSLAPPELLLLFCFHKQFKKKEIERERGREREREKRRKGRMRSGGQGVCEHQPKQNKRRLELTLLKLRKRFMDDVYKGQRTTKEKIERKKKDEKRKEEHRREEKV